MQDYKLIADNYLAWFADNMSKLKNKYRKFCIENSYDWDEDVFSDTYLKIYDIISKKGIADSSEKGYDNYTFMAFKNNIRNEKNYCRTKNRDYNVTSDNIEQLYEDWYNDNHTSSTQKLKRDLFIDFATLYIILSVEEAFDAEHARLYKLKVLVKGMTFKKLAELDENQVYTVRGLFISTKGKYGPHPVAVGDDFFIDLPKHATEDVKNIIACDDDVLAINNGLVGIKARPYEKDGKTYIGFDWVDITED